MDIDVKIDDKKVRRAMKKVQKQVRNTKPILDKIGQEEVRRAQHRVRTSKTDPDNRRWAPWAYSTLIQRQREGTASRGLLYRTGFLLKNFYHKVQGKKLFVGNKAPYAQYLQEGTRHMRPRRFLGWSADARKDIQTSVQRQVRKLWK